MNELCEWRMVKRFVCYFHFVGWDCLSIGLHVCIKLPNVELHLPFGFVRIGLVRTYPDAINLRAGGRRPFGIGARW